MDVTPKGVVIPKEVSEYEDVLNSPAITESFPEQIVYMSDDVWAPFTKIEDEPNANAYFW